MILEHSKDAMFDCIPGPFEYAVWPGSIGLAHGHAMTENIWYVCCRKMSILMVKKFLGRALVCRVCVHTVYPREFLFRCN